jgi:hypothetical protein
MFWQNPWHDVRPHQVPVWKQTWSDKNTLSDFETQTARSVLALEPVQSVIAAIDWTHFYQPPDPLDPETYSGLWEYRINQQLDSDYDQYRHDDPHPDAMIQHDFLLEIVLGQDPKLAQHRSLAHKYAVESKKFSEFISRQDLYPQDLSQPLKKFYL